VIEEADSGLDLGLAATIQIDPDPEIGLVGGAGDLGYTGHD
jgi:hypothetical protein